MSGDTSQVDSVGRFTLAAATAESSRTAEERRHRRHAALVQWLLAEWLREQQRDPGVGGESAEPRAGLSSARCSNDP